MSLTIEREIISQDQFQELGIELIVSAVDGSLTETRYDLIIQSLATDNTYPELLVQSIYQGKPAWREKHYRRYKITGLN